MLEIESWINLSCCRTPRDYERIKEKRKRNAEVKPTSNIPKDFQNIGPSISNIQTDGPDDEPGEAAGFQQPTTSNISPGQTGPTSQREPVVTSSIQQDTKSQPADSSDGKCILIYHLDSSIENIQMYWAFYDIK